MSCETQIDALAAAVDAWTATTQQSQAIIAQRQQMDSDAMVAMYQAYWNLYLCQFGEGLARQMGSQYTASPAKTSAMPKLISELSPEQMTVFHRYVLTIQKNRAV